MDAVRGQGNRHPHESTDRQEDPLGRVQDVGEKPEDRERLEVLVQKERHAAARPVGPRHRQQGPRDETRNRDDLGRHAHDRPLVDEAIEEVGRDRDARGQDAEVQRGQRRDERLGRQHEDEREGHQGPEGDAAPCVLRVRRRLPGARRQGLAPIEIGSPPLDGAGEAHDDLPEASSRSARASFSPSWRTFGPRPRRSRLNALQPRASIDPGPATIGEAAPAA